MHRGKLERVGQDKMQNFEFLFVKLAFILKVQILLCKINFDFQILLERG